MKPPPPTGPAPPPDKRLFTPGPLTTSRSVKEAMLRDAGSRDAEFIALVKEIQLKLLALGGVSPAAGYEVIPIQGSGTFAVEAVLSTVIPRDGKLLVLANGAYGERMIEIARRHRIACTALRWEENQWPDPEAASQALAQDPGITHVAAVHCETTSGILNPVEQIGAAVRGHQRGFLVDAMSSFGAVPINLLEARIDYLVSSANKCIEGVPGFAFVLARRDSLLASQGQARTLSLDLFDQWQGLEKNGQFRFTPPTHAMLAFAQALRELEEEGGPTGRATRYQANQTTLIQGMVKLGFHPYLPSDRQSSIITTFHYPNHPQFQFDRFYQLLAQRGFLIYPGKLTRQNCFRIGTIGRLHVEDVHALLHAISKVLAELGCPTPLPPPSTQVGY